MKPVLEPIQKYAKAVSKSLLFSQLQGKLLFFINLITSLLPTSYSLLDQASAVVVILTSLSVSAAMLLLVVYWLVTKSFESIKTIFVMLAIMLGLGICIWLAVSSRVSVAAWILILLMVLLNLANMAGYGIATSASAAYLIPILLAIFCISTGVGYLIAGLGCLLVFGIAFLQSKERKNKNFPSLSSFTSHI